MPPADYARSNILVKPPSEHRHEEQKDSLPSSVNKPFTDS